MSCLPTILKLARLLVRSANDKKKQPSMKTEAAQVVCTQSFSDVILRMWPTRKGTSWQKIAGDNPTLLPAGLFIADVHVYCMFD